MSLNEILSSSGISVQQRPWSDLSVASLYTGFAPGLIDFIDAGSVSGSGVLPASTLVGKFATADVSSSYALTTDSATNIISAMGSSVGTGFEFVLLNGDQGGTLTGSTGVTVLGGIIDFDTYQSTVRFFVLYDAPGHVTIWPSVSSFTSQPSIATKSPGFIDFSSLSSFSATGTLSAASLCGKLGSSSEASLITLTTDTASNIISAMGGNPTVIGNSFSFSYSNAGSAAVVISPGSGVTLGGGGSFTIPPNSEAVYSVNKTGTSAIHFYEMSRSGEQLGYTAILSGSVMDASTFVYSQMANSIVQTALTMNSTVTVDTAANIFAAQSAVSAPYPNYAVRGKIVNNSAFTLSFSPPGDVSVTIVDSAGTGVVAANATVETNLVLVSVGPPIYAFYL